VLSENVILYALVNALRNKGENITDGNLKTLFKKLSRFTSTSTDLIDGTLDDEIKSCIEFVSTHTNAETFSQIFRECLADVGNKLYKTSDILAALKSNHEIIIFKSDGYYTIPLGYADKDEIDMALSL
jgi:cob(I)alamin adenosyltransferase